MASNNNQKMKDVSHTGPYEDTSAQPVFDRGIKSEEVGE